MSAANLLRRPNHLRRANREGRFLGLRQPTRREPFGAFPSVMVTAFDPPLLSQPKQFGFRSAQGRCGFGIGEETAESNLENQRPGLLRKPFAKTHEQSFREPATQRLQDQTFEEQQ